MNTVDVAFLAIILLSILLGIVRGAVGEILSLGSLIINVYAANRYSGEIAPWVAKYVHIPGAQYALAFVLVYGIVWLVTSTISHFISAIIGTLGLGWLDKTLGVAFGAIRGLGIVLVLVLIIGLTPIPQQAIWQEAMLTSNAEHAIEQLRPMMSNVLKKRVDFKPAVWVEKFKKTKADILK
jgi:membrane protein required for colicin V production